MSGTNALLPQGNAARTIEAWVYYDGNSNNNVLLNYGTATSNQRAALLIAGSKLYYAGEYNDLAGNTVVSTNSWHHVAVTYTGTTLTLYLDGVLDQSATMAAFATTGYDWRAGCRIGGTSEYLSGRLDELRIYNVALTPAQVRADMVGTAGAAPASLVAYYNFDQGTASGTNTTVTTLTDQTASPHDGTLTNFALSSGNTTSNFVESYALVVPALTASTGVSSTGFTANWTPSALGVADNGYRLEVATSTSFAAAALVGGSPIAVPAGSTSQVVTGLIAGQTYYLRVRADKTSVTGQGDNSFTAIQRPLTPISPPGNALAFDGSDDYVAVATNPALDNLGTGSLTLESWVYVTNLTTVHSLIRKDGDYNLYLNTSGLLGLDVWPGGLGNAARTSMITTTPVAVNRWNHVAAVWNGSTIKLYLNGVEVSTTLQTGSSAGTFPLWLGRSAIYNQPLNGRLDELRIYNAALTAAQVQADMTSTSAAVPASLQLYYNFDHGTASGANTAYTTVANQTGFDGYGTLINFALTSGSTTSNWVESYALLVPANLAATAAANGTTLNTTWTAPTINGAAPAAGIVEGYVLDVSTSGTFASAVTSFPVSGYATTSQAATSLANGTNYYLRLRAEKASVTGQGLYTPTITARTVGTDAKLTNLVSSPGALSPVFAPATLAYTLYVPTGTTTFTLTPTASNGYTAITVNGTPVASGSASAALAVGSTATVTLTSEDLLTTTTYTVQAMVAPGYFRSVATGNWGDASTWETSNDGSTNWFAAPLAPTGSFVGTVSVRNGHTVTVAAATSTKTTTVESGGILNTLFGQDLTIPSGATTTVNAGGVLSIGRLTGIDGVTGTSTNTGSLSVTGANALTVNGTLVLNLGAVANTPVSQGISTSTTTISSGGRVVYYATAVGITLPAPTWSTGATLELAGGILNQTFATTNTTFTYPNVDINLANLPAGTLTAAAPSVWAGNAVATITGTLKIVSTGLGTLRLFNAPTGNANTLTLGTAGGSGGYVQQAGTNVVGSFGSTSALTGTVVNVLGSFQLNGGTFAAAQATNTGTTTLRPNPLAVAGDFAVASGATFNLLSGAVGPTLAYTVGTVTLTGSFNNAGTVSTGNTNATSTGQKLIFAKAGTQTFLNTGTISGRVNATVNATTIIDLSTQAFTGTGTFTTVAGATLRLGSPDGISASGTATGNVQSTGTRSIVAGTNIEFNGTTAQVTGTGFPTTALNAASTLTFNNTAGVTLSQALTTPGTLSFKQGIVTTTATNLLTLGSSATAVGTLDAAATNTGRVAGPFKRWVAAATASLAYPIGIATASRPATIEYTAAPTTGGTLTAEFVATAAGSQGLPVTEGSNTATKGSDDGYWHFTAADGLAGGTYAATFTFNGITGVSDYSKLLLLKRADAASDWALVGTGVATTGTNTAPVLSRTGLTGFSDFTAGLNAGPLPVELVSFDAQAQGTAALLRWRTASEKNSAYFEVQASTDGRNFQRLGQVQAQGTTTRATNYAFTDAEAQRNAPAGRRYYRLQQHDLDGTVSYSPVRTASFSAASPDALTAAPVPFHDQLTLKLQLNTPLLNAPLTLSDMAGREVLRQLVSAPVGTQAMPLSGLDKLSAGVYFLRLFFDGEMHHIKVVKE